MPRPSAAAGGEPHSTSLNGDLSSVARQMAAEATARPINSNGMSIEGGKRGHGDRAIVSPGRISCASVRTVGGVDIIGSLLIERFEVKCCCLC